MFQERTKKLFNLKKTEKNIQKHLQSLSKDLSSEENFKKFKSQKSYHPSTESQTHQKLPSSVINYPKDNKIISINLNILPKEKKISSNLNKEKTVDSKKKNFKNALSPNYTLNGQILKNKTNWIKNKKKNKNNQQINDVIDINENSSNNNKINYSMNSSLNKRNLNHNINDALNKNSGIKNILNDPSIQEIDTEENDIINITEKNKSNINMVLIFMIKKMHKNSIDNF